MADGNFFLPFGLTGLTDQGGHGAVLTQARGRAVILTLFHLGTGAHLSPGERSKP